MACEDGAVVRANTAWMTVNLLLAALPFALAVVLFVPRRPHNMTWWLGLGTFVVFLPNAPYVLTDVVHLSGQARRAPSLVYAAALVAEYSIFITVGLTLYGGCLFLLRRRLQVDGLERWRWPAELALHALCSVGIFLGSDGTNRTVVSRNVIDSNNLPGPVGGTGIYSDVPLHNAAIAFNTFNNNDNEQINITPNKVHPAGCDSALMPNKPSREMETNVPIIKMSPWAKLINSMIP